MASEPKPYLTTDNPQTSVTATTLQKYDAFVVTHRCSVVTVCARLVIGCSSIQAGVILVRCSVVTTSARSWLQDSLGSFLYGCVMQLQRFSGYLSNCTSAKCEVHLFKPI